MRFVIQTCILLLFRIAITTSLTLKMASTKLALIDRDGVINVDVGHPGVIDVSRLELTENAGVALGKLRRGGYKAVLITNQSCVGKGLITEDYLGKIHLRMHQLLLEQDPDAKFDKLFYCTSTKEQNDHRSKPNPGMIEEAMEFFGGTKDASKFDTILFIGDTLTDLQAAASASVSTRVLVETGYGYGIMRGQEAPSIDGSVMVVNSNESDIVDLTTISDSLSSKPSIFPLLYAKNFSSAVDWIVNTMTTS